MGHRTDAEIAALAPVQTVNGATGAVSVTTTSIGAATPASVSAQITAETAAAVPSATELVQGKAELATQAEVNTGTDDVRIITPLKGAAAFLKRLAGDFAAFTAKVTPVAADIILIEDSVDSNNKKKATLTDLYEAVASVKKRTQVVPVFGASGSGNPYLESTGASPPLLEAVVFAAIGSALEGTPSAVYVVLQKDDPNGNARVYADVIDYTNGFFIASAAALDPPNVTVGVNWGAFSLGAVSNWPTGAAILKLRFRRSAGDNGDRVRISSLLLVY